MEKNTGKVREFCQPGKVGTLVLQQTTSAHWRQSYKSIPLFWFICPVLNYSYLWHSSLSRINTPMSIPRANFCEHRTVLGANLAETHPLEGLNLHVKSLNKIQIMYMHRKLSATPPCSEAYSNLTHIEARSLCFNPPPPSSFAGHCHFNQLAIVVILNVLVNCNHLALFWYFQGWFRDARCGEQRWQQWRWTGGRRWSVTQQTVERD